MTFFKQAGAIFWKDVLTEFRTKDALTSMLLFGLLVILMFHFAFEPDSLETERFGPGLLWMTFLFAGLLGMNRAFAGERENDGLQGLKLAPISWGAIYLGKMLANLCFMLLVEAVILFCFALLLQFQSAASVGLDVRYHAAGYARLCIDRHHPGCDFHEHAHERRDAAHSPLAHRPACRHWSCGIDRRDLHGSSR